MCPEWVYYHTERELITFGQIFLPKHFVKKSKSPRFHYLIGDDLINAPPGQRTANVVFRYGAKTTLEKAGVMNKFGFGARKKLEPEFICWVSEEQGQAVDHIRYIRDQIDYNRRFRGFFGDLSGDKAGKRWTEKDIICSYGHRLLAKGTTQRLRGRTEGESRYTGIILDDIESELNTKTVDRRKEIRDWMAAAVHPALDETIGREGWIWYSNTVVHYDSSIQRTLEGFINHVAKWADMTYKDVFDAISPAMILGEPDNLLFKYHAWAKENPDKAFTWKVNFVPATHDRQLEPDSIPAWPGLWSLEKLRLKRRKCEDDGAVHKFAQEYMNDARDVSTAPIKVDRIKYHDGVPISRGNQAYLIIGGDAIPVHRYIGVDIAGSSGKGSDFQCAVVLDVDCERNWYVIDLFHERTGADNLARQVVAFAEKYKPIRRVNIERAGQQGLFEIILELFAREKVHLLPGIKKGVTPHDVALKKGRINKSDRLIDNLAPVVNNGRFYMRQGIHQIIYNQMFELPDPRMDDSLDALVYAGCKAKLYVPKSPKFPASELDDEHLVKEKKPQMKSWRDPYFKKNWVTGG